MTTPVGPDRTADAFVKTLLARRPGYVPEWRPTANGADIAVTEILGRYLAAIAARLDQVPDKLQLALLDALGIRLIPAQAARAPVVFVLSDTAADGRVPAGTRLAAAPTEPAAGAAATPDGTAPATTPPGPILFEVERSCGLAAAQLVELRSLWPGRDQSIDHMPAYSENQPFRPWLLADLEDSPHHLYLAHRVLLNLSGPSHVAVALELSQGGSEHLSSRWEYWDGKVWRPFRNSISDCDQVAAAVEDSTAGLRRTGTVRLLTDCAETKPTAVDGVENFWVRARLTEPLLPDPAQLLPEVEQIMLSTVITQDVAEATTEEGEPPEIAGGLLPDKILVEDSPADLSKPFYPFGLQPQPGSVFYFSSEEVLSKPGAEVEVCFVRTSTPQDEIDVGGTPLPHRVAWEYWNGRDWASVPGMSESLTGEPADLDPVSGDGFGRVLLTVPEDLEPTTVAEVEGRWLRVRLVSGGFGTTKTVTWTDAHPTPAVTNSFTYVISRPPALSALRLGYSWTYGPFAPERVLTYNDFQFRDRTEEAVWPGQVFRPFTPPADLSPALYLGFDRPLPVDRLGFYLAIEEQQADPLGPALQWEHWDGGAWRVLHADDETQRLRQPGIVGLIGPAESQPLARFGTARWWLRARLKEDGPPGSPTIRGLYPNAVWAVQQETVLDDPIGSSTGVPDQVSLLRRAPVLPDQQIEVREFAGPRAGVEWRVVARELFPHTPRVIEEIEALLRQEGTTTEISYGVLRLRRDTAKQVTEVWVRWQSREHLLRSGPNDRHYVLERSRGRLQFGNGTAGKVPPAGSAILARRYQVGGGSAGNVAVGAISQLQGSIGGVDSVSNPAAAEGGADGEGLAECRARGPATLRHRGRALSGRDLETMAREASPDVAVARALPARSADGRRQPGHVTLVIIPASADPRPWPTFGLRERVRRYLGRHADASVAGLDRIEVTGPSYVAVDVAAMIVPVEPTDAGDVERQARAALSRLLHPLQGGPDGGGWPPGRAVHLSDVAAVLERLEGIDHVADLAISVAGRFGGLLVEIPRDRTVVAGDITLTLTNGRGER